MIFAKPSFKLAIGCIILWSLLAAIIIPNADKWFKGKSSSVKEDVVVFNTSQSPAHINDAISTNYGRRNSITMNVSPIDNTPSVSHDGLKGILYDLGESCGDAPAPNLTPKSPFLVSHNNVSRIAMVKQSESCFLADKIINAELDGAVAVIVYQLNTSLKSFKSLGVMPKTVNIPAYYIDPEAGHSLLQDLSKLYKKQNETTYGHSELLIRVTLLPAQKPILEPWEFAILFVGVILVASLIVIAGMQFCMWKLAKSRQRLESGSSTDLVLTTDEQRQFTSGDEGFWRDIMGQNLSLQQLQQRGPIRQRLDQVLVDLLPTRVYQLGEVSEKKDGPAEPLYDPTSCVICLEELADGDVLRRLPCCHEYHQDCIDVWLTKRNNACPLCLALVEIPALPEDCHHS